MKLAFFILFVFAINISAQIDSSKRTIEEEPLISYAVEKMPEIIGGMDSLQKRIHYPLEATKNKIEGKVYILAYIDTIGNPLNVNVVKGIGYGCDEEALRIVKDTKFTPAITRGKKIRCPIALPIKFELPKRE